MADTYTCACCGETFEKGRDDAEALAETKAIFGNLRPEEMAIVCEDCYKLLDPANHPHMVEEAMAETLRKRK